MFIADSYSHKDGEAYIRDNHANQFAEIKAAITAISATKALCKVSKEKTKKPLLFSPINLNDQLKKYLMERGWTEKSEGRKGFKEPRINFEKGQFREMDGIKNRVGLEIQFGKYAFMGYDIFSKMPIFNKFGLIDCGIELVAMPSIVKNMSTGVSSFQQIVTDMKARGIADIDIPTLIIGIDCDSSEWSLIEAKRDLFKRGEINDPMTALNGNAPGPK